MALSAFADKKGELPLVNLLEYMESQMDRNMGRILRNLEDLLVAAGSYSGYTPVPDNKGEKLHFSTAKPKTGKVKTVAESVEKDGVYTITLDCPLYDPHEITVRIINDKIHVNAKHEIEEGDSYEHFEMVKTFEMPNGTLAEHVTSRLSSTGQLTIEVPMNRNGSILGMLVPLQVDQPSTSDIATETSPKTSNVDTQTSTDKS